MDFICIGLVVILITALIGYSRWRLSYWAKHGIYSPPSTVFLGHLLEEMSLTQNREVFFDKPYREGKQVTGFYEGHTPLLCVNDVELLQKILIKDFDHFVDRRSAKAISKRDKIMAHMLTAASGKYWKNMRSSLSPTFSSGKIKSMFDMVQEKARGFTEFCKSDAQRGANIELTSPLRNLSLDVIGTCAFGLEIDSLNGSNKKFAEAAAKSNKLTLERLGKVLIFLLTPWLAKILDIKFMNENKQFLIDTLQNVVEQRKTGAKRGDFVDLLLEAQQSNEKKQDADKDEEEFRITDTAIHAQAFLFLLAGFDTTSNSLAFVIKALGMHPEFQETIRNELMSTMKAAGRKELAYEDIMETKWLDAFIYETLRMYPPTAATERSCTKPYKLPGSSFTIPKGMTINIPIWSLHHDERFYPDPFTFKPERFLPENKTNIPTAAYLAFGGGPRMCIGMRFAMMNMKITIAELLLKYSISLAPGYENIRLSKSIGFLRQMENTCQVVLKPL